MICLKLNNDVDLANTASYFKKPVVGFNLALRIFFSIRKENHPFLKSGINGMILNFEFFISEKNSIENI